MCFEAKCFLNIIKKTTRKVKPNVLRLEGISHSYGPCSLLVYGIGKALRAV